MIVSELIGSYQGMMKNEISKEEEGMKVMLAKQFDGQIPVFVGERNYE